MWCDAPEPESITMRLVERGHVDRRANEGSRVRARADDGCGVCASVESESVSQKEGSDSPVVSLAA